MNIYKELENEAKVLSALTLNLSKESFKKQPSLLWGILESHKKIVELIEQIENEEK